MLFIFVYFIFHPFTSWVWGLYEHLDISVTYKIASSTKFQQIHIFLSRLDIPATFFSVQCSVYFQVVEYYPCLDVYNKKNVHFSIYLQGVCFVCRGKKKRRNDFGAHAQNRKFVQCRDNTFNHIAVIILYAQGTQSVE